MNALADGDFNPETWTHRAFYVERHGRIELWVESAVDQTVRVAGETLRFAAGDRIHTENSYKYDVEEVLALAAPAWRPLPPLERSRGSVHGVPVRPVGPGAPITPGGGVSVRGASRRETKSAKLSADTAAARISSSDTDRRALR